MAQQTETTTSNCINDSIIDEDAANTACTDSGYSSLGSLSHASSINASTLRPSASHYLQPIYENVQLNSFSKQHTELTPTSQSIRKINEFHITSPLSSLKRSASSLPCTPNKHVSPRKMMRLDGRDRSKLHRNLIHLDEDSENRNTANIELSPIKAVNVLQDRNGKFERKGSFSSTPIYEDSLLKSMSVTKTDFFNSTSRAEQNSLVIRKTKSFSPSKKKWLVARSRQVSVESTTPIPEDKELPSTPARKSIRRMLCRQDAIQASPEPSTSNLFDITATDFFDSNINVESPVNYKSPSPPVSSSPSIEVPAKKIRRNLSFNLVQQSPKKELDKIIFSKIPCSPHKQRIGAATKRSSTTKDVAVVAKRPQFDLSPLLPQRKSYAHLKHFDIVSHLAETGTAIKMIFSHLTPKDIHHMYNVCQNWRSIIDNYGFASQRNKFLSTLAKNKENLPKKPLLKSRSLNAIVKSPLKRANSLNLRKNSLSITSKQTSFDDDPLLLIKQNQRRTKCPTCLRPSIITQLKDNNEPNKINEKRIPFQRSIYCDKNLFADDRKSSNSNSRYEFAECTKCGFKFCMNCKCEFHGSDRCPVKTFIAPMGSDDEENDVKTRYPTGSRSKRNLRRLCSLDKVKFSSLG